MHITDKLEGLPRAGGGVSLLKVIEGRYDVSSPRRRGCFLEKRTKESPAKVFPAQAGVFLFIDKDLSIVWGLPRAGGGVSINSKLGN